MYELISKQAVIEVIDNHIFYDDYDGMDKIDLINAIKALLSAERCGRWIKKYKKAPFDNSYEWVCSECGASPFRKAADVWGDETKTAFSNYCLNCGAKMESERK